MIGTHDAFACPIDSIVCGITLSSAAITITAIFVSFAPLALKLVKSSCQGVSINVIALSSYCIIEAHIDCVIPPASASAIVVFLR